MKSDAIWKDLEFDGSRAVTKVAAVFQIGTPLPNLPFASFKVKVLERPRADFLAVPNVARVAPDGSPDWLAGLGNTVDEALADCLKHLEASFGEMPCKDPEDSVWADCSEF